MKEINLMIVDDEYRINADRSLKMNNRLRITKGGTCFAGTS